MPRALRSGWTQAAGHPPPLPAGLDAAGQQAFYRTQLANPNSPLNISTLDKDPKLTFYSSAGPVQKRRAEKAYFRTNRLRARVSSNYGDRTRLQCKEIAADITLDEFRQRVNRPSTTKLPKNGMTYGDASLYRWAKASGEMPPAQAWLDDIGPHIQDIEFFVDYIPVTNVPRPTTRSWPDEQLARIRLKMGPGGRLNQTVIGPVVIRPGGAPATGVDFANFTSIHLRVRRRALAIRRNYVAAQGRFTGFTMADLDSIVAELRFDWE